MAEKKLNEYEKKSVKSKKTLEEIKKEHDKNQTSLYFNRSL